MYKNYFENEFQDVVFDVDMGNYTTFKTGGKAAVLCKPRNLEELKKLLKIISENDIPHAIMGNGSNVLFAKELFDGVVVRVDKNFNDIELLKQESVINTDNTNYENSGIVRDGNTYTVSAGTMLVRFAKMVCNDGYTGMEFATGIPGTVGGAVYMNAGCYGREIVDCLTKVTALNKKTLEVCKFSNEECKFGYRDSFFQNDNYIILNATFNFEKGDIESINEKVKQYQRQRTEKQPLSLPNAGSTFKRPHDDFAGRLIEEAGLKGCRIGGAEVSTLHAGFVVNIDNAKANDIIELVEHVKNTVFEKLGVTLELEIKVF